MTVFPLSLKNPSPTHSSSFISSSTSYFTGATLLEEAMAQLVDEILVNHDNKKKDTTFVMSDITIGGLTAIIDLFKIQMIHDIAVTTVVGGPTFNPF